MTKSLYGSLSEENLKSTSTIGILRWKVELEVVIDKVTVRAFFSSEDCTCQDWVVFFFFLIPCLKPPLLSTIILLSFLSLILCHLVF